MPPGPHILIVDDHALFRSGLALVLAAGISGVRVREAASIQGALQEAEAPQLVLLDIRLQGLSGLEGIALVRRAWPQAPVVMLSSHAEADVVRDALARGAAAFVSKADPADRMLAAVQRALAGDTPAAAALPARGGRLTPRQCEVLDLLCEGLSNKAIGRRLDLSEHTVRGHVQATLAALRVSSRSQAVFAARQRGLVH